MYCRTTMTWLSMKPTSQTSVHQVMLGAGRILLFFLLNKVATKSKDHFPLCDGRVQIRDVGVTKHKKERIN